MLAGAAIGVAELASAADLAPLPVAPRFSWTGCYVGGYIGFATANTWQSTDLGSSAPFSPIGANPWSYSENTSFVGGGNVGCNYQRGRVRRIPCSAGSSSASQAKSAT